MTTPRRTAITRGLLVLMSLALGFAILEIGLRTVYLVKNKSKPPYSLRSGAYGWISAPNREFSYFKKHYGEIAYSTNEDGFRSFGDVESGKIRIFFIGDSFTQAYHVSDGHAYFDVVGKLRPDVEIFAYGAGGYGTLQEVLALDNFAPKVQPDIVVLQLHANDILNNDFELESSSRENNNHMRRPYLEPGGVVFRHPDGAIHLLSRASLVFRQLVLLRDSVLKRISGTVETTLDATNPDLRRSLATTRTLLANAQALAGDAAFLVLRVPSGDAYPYESILETELCRDQTWHCIAGIEESLDAARRQGGQVESPGDSHWNRTGHDVAGQLIVDYLVLRGLLSVQDGS